MKYEHFENEFGIFKYFLECYFSPSFDYKDLESLAVEFKEVENIKYVEQLKREVNSIKKMENKDNAIKFVRQYGMRKLDSSKMEWLLLVISDNI